MARDIVAPGDVVGNPAPIAGYGPAFEGTISLRIRDDGTVIAEGFAQGGSNGVIGEFKADLTFQRRPDQRLGIVEAFEKSGLGKDLHLFRESRSSSGSVERRQAETQQQGRGSHERKRARQCAHRD